ncbi:hypothetical protein AV530_000928 [Patagioenas fasciata monilis]|uniref:Uncharacterized protein n=1 Tax=Patagioenas fasciata monilis TaxID=372326 RepID=A0A1V4KSL3_PATFA|nr:hypothetical protein AV530_000928 [Patagioenas fasciata monilis]
MLRHRRLEPAPGPTLPRLTGTPLLAQLLKPTDTRAVVTKSQAQRSGARSWVQGTQRPPELVGTGSSGQAGPAKEQPQGLLLRHHWQCER